MEWVRGVVLHVLSPTRNHMGGGLIFWSCYPSVGGFKGEPKGNNATVRKQTHASMPEEGETTHPLKFSFGGAVALILS